MSCNPSWPFEANIIATDEYMQPRQTHSQDNRIATLKQTISTLQKLLSVSRRLNSTLEMRPLLQQIVESAAELTDADGASILLMEDSDTLRFAAASGPESATLQNTEVPLDRSLAGWVAKHGLVTQQIRRVVQSIVTD